MKSAVGTQLIRACAVAFLLLADPAIAGPGDTDDPSPRHVTSQACKTCHEQQFRDWSDSHHAWAMRLATEESVFGDFDDVQIEIHGVNSRFFKRDRQFLVETEGTDGDISEFEIKYTAGVAPLQQYLVELKGGRLQALSLAWDVERRRWFRLHPDQRIAPDDGMHWTGVYQNWNGRCAECHSTDFVKNYDPATKNYASTWTDINVGCESCHGPGEAHITWAKRPETYDEGRFSGVGQNGLTVDFGSLTAAEEVEICAACHARRQSLAPRSRIAGEPFLDDFIPALLREGLYHVDGQILEEVYVYGSFLQSKMYARGVRCTDCHDAHRLETRARGNAICSQCHNPAGNPRFPDLKRRRYDATSHHFHPPGSAGGLCVNCHMPARTYMVVDPRRDHGFKVPRPDLSLSLGTPNACTMCHVDRDDAWAAAQLKTWYPDGRSGRPHYAEALAAGRRGTETAAKVLGELSRDAAAPGIVRATALDLLRRYGATGADMTRQLLVDPDPLLRRGAVALQAHASPAQRLERLLPLLDDPVRAIRIEVARVLADVPMQAVPEAAREKLAAARAEYQASLLANADFPETQMNLAALAYRLRKPQAAIAALKTALEMDLYLGDAWRSLAELQSTLGQNTAAERTLHSALEKLPDAGSLNYALGLMQGRKGDFIGAVDSLERAAKAIPDDPRVRYNLGLVLQRLGRNEAASEALREALEQAPEDFDIVYAFALNELERGNFDIAEAGAKRLIILSPESRAGWQLLEEIGRQR